MVKANKMDVKKILEAWRTVSHGPGYVIQKDDETGAKRKKAVDEKMDRDELNKAMAAFKAKGGKVTKAPAAKAQGYHGKEDPGADMHGMLDKGDTKKSVMGTRKKVKSMEAKVNELSPATKEGYGGTSFSMKAMSKMKPQEKEKPPFDNSKPMQKDTKDKFGNPIKNRARHLARKAARDLLNKAK